MAEHDDLPRPFAGEPARRALRRDRRPSESRIALARRRALTWLAWWVLMMAFWVMIDDSLQFDELLAGAGAAAISAFAAEAVAYQADIRIRVRPGWRAAAEVFRLPGHVARDTLIVFGALVRTLVTGRPPDGGFAEVPVDYGEDTPFGESKRVLLIGARSLAPNTFVLGLDSERDVMVVHHLVRPQGEER
ncbi:MAG: Na+/H+ antiporter subunit E [Trebonia sp.]